MVSEIQSFLQNPSSYEEGLSLYIQSGLGNQRINLQLSRSKDMPRLIKQLQIILEKLQYKIKYQGWQDTPVQNSFVDKAEYIAQKNEAKRNKPEPLPIVTINPNDSIYTQLQNVANQIVDALYDKEGNQLIADEDVSQKLRPLVNQALELDKKIQTQGMPVKEPKQPKMPKTIGELITVRNNTRSSISKAKKKLETLQNALTPDLVKVQEAKEKLARLGIHLHAIELQIEGLKAEEHLENTENNLGNV